MVVLIKVFKIASLPRHTAGLRLWMIWMLAKIRKGTNLRFIQQQRSSVRLLNLEGSKTGYISVTPVSTVFSVTPTVLISNTRFNI